MLKPTLMERNNSKVSIDENFKSRSKFDVLKPKKKSLALYFFILFFSVGSSMGDWFGTQLDQYWQKKIITKELLSNHK